jgi:hypothetical protein
LVILPSFDVAAKFKIYLSLSKIAMIPLLDNCDRTCPHYFKNWETNSIFYSSGFSNKSARIYNAKTSWTTYILTNSATKISKDLYFNLSFLHIDFLYYFTTY